VGSLAARRLNVSERCLLAVFAHPDDEAYRPGGTLALLARRPRVGRKHAGAGSVFGFTLPIVA